MKAVQVFGLVVDVGHHVWSAGTTHILRKHFEGGEGVKKKAIVAYFQYMKYAYTYM